MLINILSPFQKFPSCFSVNTLPLACLKHLMNFLGYITWCNPTPCFSRHGGCGSQSAYVEHFLSFLDNEEWSFQETCFVQADIKSALSQPESGVQLNMIKSERLKTSPKYYNRK